MLRQDALDFAAFFKSWTVTVRWPFAATIIWSSFFSRKSTWAVVSEQGRPCFLTGFCKQSKRVTEDVSLPSRLPISEGFFPCEYYFLASLRSSSDIFVHPASGILRCNECKGQRSPIPYRALESTLLHGPKQALNTRSKSYATGANGTAANPAAHRHRASSRPLGSLLQKSKTYTRRSFFLLTSLASTHTHAHSTSLVALPTKCLGPCAHTHIHIKLAHDLLRSV